MKNLHEEATHEEPDPNQLELPDIVPPKDYAGPAPAIPEPKAPPRRADPQDWRYRLSAQGIPEAFNPQTGEVAYRDLTYEELGKYEMVMLEGERWWVPVSGDHEVETATPRKRYSSLLGDLIASHIMEGGTIKDVCKRVGITYGVFSKWRRQHEDFRQMVDDAKRDRAEVFFEKMVDIIENTGSDKDEVALSRLKTDVYRHMAAVGNENFSPVNRQKIDARIGAVSVETGIRRPGDEGYAEPSEFAVIEEGQRRVKE